MAKVVPVKVDLNTDSNAGPVADMARMACTSPVLRSPNDKATVSDLQKVR